LNLYSVFLAEFLIIAASTPQSESEVMNHFGIERVQVRKWLKQAERERRVEKLAVKGRLPVWVARFDVG